MFDDVFAVINDWFPGNQELMLEESNLNSDEVSQVFESEYNLFLIENNSDFTEEQSLLDAVESSDNFNSLAENSVINYEENLAELANIAEVAETETLSYSSDPFYYYDNSFDYHLYEENWDLSEFDGVGNPFADADCWQQQQGQNSCAVVAQMGVYESITGVELSEDAVCEFAEVNGLFDPRIGTYPKDVGRILNHFGVPTETQYDADLNDIAEALERGDKVIVGLDANEIWQPLRDEYGNPLEQSDGGHAVWVTGIDQADDGSIKLILNDSGTPDGQMKVVDAVDFVNAWDDFGNQIVVAHNSPPAEDNLVSSLGGYYNADGTYHYTSDNTDRDPETGAIIRQW